MDVRVADERTSRWETHHPVFRVYLFVGGAPAWTTDTFDIADADVVEVIRWAQDRAGPADLFAVALLGQRDGELGLTWLTGLDANDADAETRSGFRQMLERRGRPVVRPADPAPPGDVREVELVGGVERRELVLVDYDARWPDRFEAERQRIAGALGPTALRIEHIGSTAVPGLAAKPIVDVLVTVSAVADDEAYRPHLLDAGYLLRTREPGHRMFRTPDLDVHVHVLQHDDEAVAAYLDLRDRLRASEVARQRYTAVKRAVIATGETDMNAYSDAKSDVIAAIRAGRY